MIEQRQFSPWGIPVVSEEEFLKPRKTRKSTSKYTDLLDLSKTVIGKVFVPPRRMTVSEWAQEHREVNQPGAYIGPYRNETTPYMEEPADELTSTFYKGEIFVGSAQTGKTDGLIVNWTGYGAHLDGQDMMIVCQSFVAARDFSMRRIDRLIRYTPEVKKALAKGASADNKFDKTFDNGMLLTISHPSKNELSGKPIGRIAITDYDRIDDDIDGEGNAYDLASKRTTTYRSNAMTLAESSPSREITDYKKVVTGHMAPPTTGILALYNRGDRRRWQWPCPACDHYFEGEWEHIKWDNDKANNTMKAKTAYMECPHCSYHIKPKQRYQMNLWGQWVKEGQWIDEDGYIRGKGNGSNIASFWLKGVAAAFVTWTDLVKIYLDAEDDYLLGGDEGALRKFFNNDLGVPYVPKHISESDLRTPETLQARCESWTYKKVPPRVRFLLGLVDVQKNAFVVQIIGVAPGAPFDLYLVDRFTIQYSDRRDENAPEGKESYLWVKPHAFLDDWEKIKEQVMLSTYELDDDSGRKMTVKLTLCDSGGKSGATTNAYNFWRRMREQGLASRFHLLKGDSQPGAPRTRITYPDSEIAKDKSRRRGEIPVLQINPTIVKDNLDARLDVMEEGKGMIHLPDWLVTMNMLWFFAELTSETRLPGKGWEKVAKRNEAWDLFYYAIGACVSSLVGIERVNWDNPPPFAADWDNNPLVIEPEAKVAYEHTNKKFDFASFGRNMG
jgi:phage terminase large subunit GpA-like protein